MPAGRICGTSMAFRFPKERAQPPGCPSQKTALFVMQLVKHSCAQSELARILEGKGKFEIYLERGGEGGGMTLGCRGNEVLPLPTSFVYID